MAEHRARRVFINNLDSYASRCIAKFLSSCVSGASLLGDGEVGDGGERDGPSGPGHGGGSFHIVGTVSDRSTEKHTHVLEEYFQPKRPELLRQLMSCDVIIYNVTQHAEQVEEASWAVSALHRDMSGFAGPKMFILISTVMTWALSKPVDPEDVEIPFTDEDYRRRRAHPNFKRHIDLEKLVVKMGKTKRTLFSTYVVASGLHYGMGEQIFHFFFKTSWLGQAPVIPVFGEGTNIVPTIHINDLASVIQNVIDHKPNTYYLLAVDDSKNTMEDIVKTVASVLGSGKIQKLPSEEASLIRDLTQMEMDSMLVSLRMEAVYAKERFNVRWACEAGLVENIDTVVDEYKRTRGLLPIRLCILGPPAVGKSTVAQNICRHYKLHHVRLQDTITETIAHLEATVQSADPEEDNEDSIAAAQELLDALRDSMEQNGGRLEEQHVIRVMRDKLRSSACRNQGFVLDGFPKTYEQAKELFCADEDEPEDVKSKVPPHNKNIIPDCVFCLDASDGFLKERVVNLSESLVQQHSASYGRELFLRRLSRYRENNVEDETVLNYFDELDVPLQHMEITSGDDPGYTLVTQRVVQAVGPPRNYGLDGQEAQEEERRAADHRLRRQARERAETERLEAEEAEHRATRWEEWSEQLEEARLQEEQLLEERSLPMRSYLMENVLPTLTQGLIECCAARPPDPLEYLAEYLFRNNPLND